MTGLPTIINVDFNRLDDNDVVWAPRDAAPEVSVHQTVILEDGEENRCMGTVRRLDAKRIYVVAALSTWQDAHPVDVTVEAPELFEALRRQIKAIVEPQPTFGVNVQ